MPTSSAGQPKYLMCARALALLSGLAAGSASCGSTLPSGNTDSGSKDASGSDLVSTPYDGGVHGVQPYDGGVQGVQIMPNDGSQPYDGARLGLFGNPDATGTTTPYDGGFFGVRINPDAH
jgi:hypothetical protein